MPTFIRGFYMQQVYDVNNETNSVVNNGNNRGWVVLWGKDALSLRQDPRTGGWTQLGKQEMVECLPWDGDVYDGMVNANVVVEGLIVTNVVEGASAGINVIGMTESHLKAGEHVELAVKYTWPSHNLSLTKVVAHVSEPLQ
jgi:hypothetical protein